MVEQESAAQKSESDEREDLENEPSDEAPEEDESQSAATEPTTARWAIRGAVVGAVAGSVVGAGVGALIAHRPEALKQVTGLMGGNAKQIASAAGVAAADVVASRGLNQLVSGDGKRRPGPGDEGVGNGGRSGRRQGGTRFARLATSGRGQFMTPDSEEGEGTTEMAGGSGRLGMPLFIAAAFAAGAGAALGTKAFLDSRRKGSHDEESGQESGQDLPSVLRRAGLDVAIAATNQAAKRLTQDQSQAQNGESARQQS